MLAASDTTQKILLGFAPFKRTTVASAISVNVLVICIIQIEDCSFWASKLIVCVIVTAVVHLYNPGKNIWFSYSKFKPSGLMRAIPSL